MSVRHPSRNWNDVKVTVELSFHRTSQEERRNSFAHSPAGNATHPTAATEHLLTSDLCVSIYGGLIAGIFIVAITRSITFYNVCIRASQNLHDNMFCGIITTTMRFFNLNPSGRILNRFAKDMGVIDELLPRVLLDAIQTNLNMTGAIILTAVVNPISLLPILCVGIVFVIARKVYLRTSKNIKRLEGISEAKPETFIFMLSNECHVKCFRFFVF